MCVRVMCQHQEANIHNKHCTVRHTRSLKIMNRPEWRWWEGQSLPCSLFQLAELELLTAPDITHHIDEDKKQHPVQAG